MHCTSREIALATFIPLPFIIVTTAYRLWIRHHRQTWGADDWAMLALVPVWTVNVVGLVGMAWSGVGASDASLSYEQQAQAYFWFYVFQEFWCFTLVAVKWSLGFTLIRIAGPVVWVEIIIYVCLALVTAATGGTGMYLFFQCSPVQKNWYTLMPGHCNARAIQTALSYLVAAVSITTDWIFALLPIFLLWNVQMKTRVKLSAIAVLSLGIFASIAPIVRLKYLLGMNDLTHLLENLGEILAWAAAEANVGMLIANLPACRPLLDSMFAGIFSSRDKSSGIGGASGTPGSHQQYLELDERRGKSKASASIGVETRMYGSELERDSLDGRSLANNGSQKQIVSAAAAVDGQIYVKKEFGMEVTLNGHNV